MPGLAFSVVNSCKAHDKVTVSSKLDRTVCPAGRSKPEALLSLPSCPGGGVKPHTTGGTAWLPQRGARHGKPTLGTSTGPGLARSPVLSQKTLQGGRVSLQTRHQDARPSCCVTWEVAVVRSPPATSLRRADPPGSFRLAVCRTSRGPCGSRRAACGHSARFSLRSQRFSTSAAGTEMAAGAPRNRRWDRSAGNKTASNSLHSQRSQYRERKGRAAVPLASPLASVLATGRAVSIR